MTRRGRQNKKIPKLFRRFEGSLQHWGWKSDEAFPDDETSSSPDPLPPPIAGPSQPGIQFQFIDYQHPVSPSGPSARNPSPSVPHTGNSSIRRSNRRSPHLSAAANSSQSSRSRLPGSPRRLDGNNTETLRLANEQTSLRSSSHRDQLEAGNASRSSLSSSSSSSQESRGHLSPSIGSAASFFNQQSYSNQSQGVPSLSPSTSQGSVSNSSTNLAQFSPTQAMQQLSMENYALPPSSLASPRALQQLSNPFPIMGIGDMTADDVRYMHRNHHAMDIGNNQATAPRYFNTSMGHEYYSAHSQTRLPASSYARMSDSSTMPLMNPNANSGYDAAYRHSMDQYFYSSSSSSHYFPSGENYPGSSQSSAQFSFPALPFDPMMAADGSSRASASSSHPASRRRPTDLGSVPSSYAMDFGSGYDSTLTSGHMTNALSITPENMNYADPSQLYMYQENSGHPGQDPNRGGQHHNQGRSASRGPGY